MRSRIGKDKRVPRARRLRRATTDAERRLWLHLRHLPVEGTHFRRQATIGPYFADFACHTRRLVVELDGGQHNFGQQAKRDADRDRYFETNGYRVLRFRNNDVLSNTQGVLEVIVEALCVPQPPTPDPSPPLASLAGGGESQPPCLWQSMLGSCQCHVDDEMAGG
jgi:very-short-patch-repair endonuclease